MSNPAPQPVPDPRSGTAPSSDGVVRHLLAHEGPLDAAALEAVEATDIVVVGGLYDRVELALGALALPFVRIGPSQLEQVELRREQLVVLGCSAELRGRDVWRLRDFVTIGGSLFTTDWALGNVIERAFPDTIAFRGRPTLEDVVPIEILEHDNPFLACLLGGPDEPRWRLESASHPITVLDHDRVRTLIASPAMEARYGGPVVAALFPWGDGEVFHVTSHYELQGWAPACAPVVREGAAEREETSP